MPDNVNRVPALLLLDNGYNVLYGDMIVRHLQQSNTEQVRVATQNNMEPSAFAFSEGGAGAIQSDCYSFLDQSSDELSAKGSGGERQMHNYVNLHQSDIISTPADGGSHGTTKMSENVTVDSLSQQRESDLVAIRGSCERGIGGRPMA